MQIHNTFQALITHHEWINRTFDESYTIDIQRKLVFLQKTGISTHNINNEYAFWNSHNRWTPIKKYKTTTPKSHPKFQHKPNSVSHTWTIHQKIDIQGTEFTTNRPYIPARITGHVKDTWEVQPKKSDTKYYWTTEQLNKIASTSSPRNAKHLDTC